MPALLAFFSWPEFGDMLGGRFDEHPWDIIEATRRRRRSHVSGDAAPAAVVRRQDEHYQMKDFSQSKMRVLARLDPAKLDLKAPLVHRTDGDFPVAWTKDYGKGRVFYSTLGHDAETWDNAVVAARCTSKP